MPHPIDQFRPNHDLFVGIDSDGCVFDSMEIKHKECFCPRFIQYYSLQAVSKFARESWEFVNLYSTTRGTNRFKAVLRSLDILAQRKEVIERGVEVPRLPTLRAWVAEESTLSNAVLQKKIESLTSGSPEREELELVMSWSTAVNATVKEIVYGVPPFPGVRDSLEALAPLADIVVVSQTPVEALDREWEENKIDTYAAVIAGQEQGSKKEHLQMCTSDGRYASGRVVMIGDAPGDEDAARTVGALFYPILPGNEAESWRRFHGEAIPRLIGGSWDDAYETELLEEFSRALPEDPPWKRS